MPETGETLLAFDFGLKRIGVAIGTRIGDSLAAARPLTTISAAANDARFAAIEALVAEWQPQRLVVGRPLNEDGTPHEMTARCERFANQLRGRFRLPVDAVDERLSSQAADQALRERGLDWRRRKAVEDAEAALLILHDWSSRHARDAA
jgi:putative Holliday junction resolvase